MKTAVIILNYNGEKLLQEFLPGVVANSGAAEVVVADNGSTDGSLAWIAQEMPQVTVVPFEKNYGFAEGYNRAIEAIEAEYVVLLNSDVEVTPNWLDPMEEYLDQNPNIVACQPKILSYKDRSLFEYAGASGGFLDKYGYPYCRGRVMSVVEKDEGQYDSIIPIFWATGAALFIRRSIYQEVGGLDSRFFAHMEEIDLCWRLNARGYDTVCIPQSVVYHVGGATLNEEHPRKTYLNFRNNALMLYKNLPQEYWFNVSSMRVLLDFVAALQMFLQGKGKNAVQIFKARKDYRHLKQEFKQDRYKNLALTKRNNLIGQLNYLLLWRVYIHKEQKYDQLPKAIGEK